jgi:hypothetical protein
MPNRNVDRNSETTTADAVETALDLAKGSQTVSWARLSRSASSIQKWSSGTREPEPPRSRPPYRKCQFCE